MRRNVCQIVCFGGGGGGEELLVTEALTLARTSLPSKEAGQVGATKEWVRRMPLKIQLGGRLGEAATLFPTPTIEG